MRKLHDALTIFAALLFLLVAGSVSWAADEADHAWRSEMTRCASLSDRDQRLACYDAASAAMRNQSGGSSAFGRETLPVQHDGDPESLNATVTGKIAGIKKNDIFNLSNGQVWRCVDDRVYPDYSAENPTVILQRNLIGNYWMRFGEGGVNIRVRRIR